MRPIVLMFMLVLFHAAHAGAQSPGLLPHEAVSNWGRWGADDQRGAANLITPARVAEAAKLIQTGETYSLAIPLDGSGPVFPGRLPPHHTFVTTGADYAVGGSGPFASSLMKFSDDYIYMALQGSTQWDGLAHAWYGDTLYNGVPQTAIRSAPGPGGATKLGIEHVRSSLVGRAVLVDVLRFKGGALAPGYAITRADVEGALEKQGTKVAPGDIVIFRTGVVPAFYQIESPVDRTQFLLSPMAGIGKDVVAWAKAMDVAGLAADNLALEQVPSELDPAAAAPLHGNLLRDMGVYIGEIWWLEELAEACAADGRFEFFLAAQPLHIPGAVGSPVNPIAIR